MTAENNHRSVRDEMSTDVASIESTASVLDALQQMEDKGVTSLPIVDPENRCIGVVSTTDVVRAARATAMRLQELAQADPANREQIIETLVTNGIGAQSVEDLMRYKLKSVDQDMTVVDASTKMLWTRFHHLPVIDDRKRLVGIVSSLDLLASFVKAADKEAHADPADPEELGP